MLIVTYDLQSLRLRLVHYVALMSLQHCVRVPLCQALRTDHFDRRVRCQRKTQTSESVEQFGYGSVPITRLENEFS